MKQKITVFHPAIAPYRVDLFNSLSEAFDASLYFEHKDVLEQKFDNKALFAQLNFTPKFLVKGLFGVKNLRLEVLRILWKECPDIVLCSEYNIIGFLILLYKYLFCWRLKIVSICDDSYDMAVRCKGLRKWMRSILCRCFNGIVLCDKKSLVWYESCFKGYDKFHYFPIIQNEKRFQARLNGAKQLSEKLLAQYGLENKRILLYVGRLTEVKNLPMLLQAFSLLCQDVSDARLVIVGDGFDRSLLENLAMEFEVQEKVLFIGKKEGEELMAWYNIGEVFVLPSTYEPFGAVTNEALIAGCYVFCSDKAGSSCLIEEGKNGSLFSPTDIEALYSGIQGYLKKEQPPIEYRNRMLISYQEEIGELMEFIQAKSK